MARTPTLLALALIAGTTAAQNYEELPKGFTKTVDNAYDYFLLPRLSYLPVHIQYAYDVNDVSVPAAPMRAVTWRRNNYYSNSVPAGSITVTVTMSHGPNAPSAMSTTFASNLSTMTTMVYTGTANFPAAPKATGPAPWTHAIPFARPFVFSKASGKSLVIDLVIAASTGYTSTHTMDAAGPARGTRTSNPRAQSTCKFSNSKYNNSLSYLTGGLTNKGGPWYVRYGSILPNAPGIATLSIFGNDNKGPWPLRIDLTPLGAPGCFWDVGLEMGLWVPITATASGTASWPSIQIPPGLGGLAFYDHALFLDKAANNFGFVATWSSKWSIASSLAPKANTLYMTADTNKSPTGRFRTGYGTHVRLTR
ncbi:MAG: hypothetical protein CMJ85_05665 [Planctomycetes bacterium]|jgi:hypothetical protein|nr:hypothetical protein [Planctomycetota bacterium]MDP6425291.1 hypothetical protein [Planctomycetota bacterium]